MAEPNVREFPDDVNATLRALARSLASRFDTQREMAESLGVSAGYLSDFIHGKRGSGLNLLRGLGQIAPIELLRMLNIDLGSLLTLLRNAPIVAQMLEVDLPDSLRRARDAAVPLTGCSVDHATTVAKQLLDERGDAWADDPDPWLHELRKRIPSRGSGVVARPRRRSKS
jgi:transcriptional regulator with XRE-family HTH domain